MDEPQFPEGFETECCPLVGEARTWRRNFKLEPDPDDDKGFAQCALVNKGSGIGCENCYLFLSMVGKTRPKDEKWVPQVEDYLAKVKVWAKHLAELEKPKVCPTCHRPE